MDQKLGTTLKGSWRPGIKIDQRDYMGGDAMAVAVSGGSALHLSQTLPGLHPFYYGQAGDYLHWDESEWRLHRKLRGLGVKKPKVHPVEGGATVAFDGRVTSTRIAPTQTFAPVDHLTSVDEARDEMEQRLLDACDDIYSSHGRGPVTLLLSGGVDSIAIAWAMKEIGADVECVTVGRTSDDFDPKWAKRAADTLGFPHVFLPLPSDDAELQRLLARTLRTIEQTSFSNVLMGMCCSLVHDRMVETGRKVAYLGFWGDLLFGHKLQVVGSFNLLPEHEKSDAAWTRKRVETCWYLKPHTLQLAKGFREGGETTWRVPFLHPLVRDFAFGLPRSFAPPVMDKPLLYGTMERHLPPEACAWHDQKKIGFYTGAGIGKTRLTNPILQDANIRATFAHLKKQLS
jgi:asparagine synthetase B (glutamine-hydrolysing)